MLRIAHFSDFHMTSNCNDFKNFIIPALLDDLEKHNTQKQIDLIFFSGDLIDKGGESFNNDTLLALLTFQEVIIEPIISKINLTNNRVFITPGNHDISRNEDSFIIEDGLKKNLSSTQIVNDFIANGNEEGIKRVIPFKTFERDFYRDFNEKNLSNFQSLFKFTLDGVSIGVACFNSAWRSYDTITDNKKLILGESQLINARNFLKGCETKIAIMHHSFDSLVPFDQKASEPIVIKDYDMLLCGHFHEGNTWTKSDMHGKLFISIAPSNWPVNLRIDSRSYAIGYYLLDYDENTKQISTYARRYSHSNNCFTSNSDLGDESGKKTYCLLDDKALVKYAEEMTVIEFIKSHHYNELNEHLLSYSTKNTLAPKEINNIFVVPRLTEQKEDNDEFGKKETTLSLEELYNNPDSKIIFGIKESGKTILLDKILIDLIENMDGYHIVPVYFNFEDIPNDNYRSTISKFLHIGIKEINTFLAQNKVVLLIDNLSFNKKYHYKIKSLEQFLKDNPLQIIATCRQIIENMIPSEIYDYITFTSFRRLTINSFRTKEIKSLAKAWFSNNENFFDSEQIDKLIENFTKISLPRTPLAISMVLWILEQNEGSCRPINHAIMLETFMELLLKKASSNEMFSDNFDYKNKERLLADLAFQMLDKDKKNYRIRYIDVLNFIDETFKAKKFELFDSHDKILEGFITAGILVKEIDEGTIYIRFRFPCYLQYFTMKKMDFSPKFRDMVLLEDNYLSYINEIDYYTGLKRDQVEILKMLVERLNVAYKTIIEKTTISQYAFENLFTDVPSFIDYLDDALLDEVSKSPDHANPSIDEMRDLLLEKREAQGTIEHKEYDFDNMQRLRMLLSVTGKVLKNTEETGDNNEEDTQIKEEAYKNILTCLLADAKLDICRIEKISREQINKIGKKMEDTLDDIVAIQKKMMPFVYGSVLTNLLGTKKQSGFYREKIYNDLKNNNISEFEKFLSVFLYAAIGGDDFKSYVERFVKQISSDYIIDSTFIMVMSLYCTKSRTSNTDREYENLLASLRLNIPKLHKPMTTAQVKTMVKDQFLQKIRKMRQQWRENEGI